MFEEFDYSLERNREDETKMRVKKIIRVAGVIIAFFVFLYILIASYNFVRNKPSPSEVDLIEAETHDIKTAPDSQESMKVDNVDMTVYDVIGEEAGEKGKVRFLDGSEIKGDNRVRTQNKALMANIKSNKVAKPVDVVGNLDGTKRVQVAALQTREKAEEYWRRVSDKHSELLSEKEYFIEEADLGEKGTFYRLQIGSFATSESAKDFCTRYLRVTGSGKTGCIVINASKL